jgi:hypothetical protein
MNHDERRIEKTNVIGTQYCGTISWDLIEAIQLEFPQRTRYRAYHTPRARLQLRRTTIYIARLSLANHYINTPISDAAAPTSKPL